MKTSSLRIAALSVALAFSAFAGAQTAQPVQSSAGAEALQAKYKSVQPQLTGNMFQRPLVLASNEASDRLSGDIYAVVDHPFEEVGRELKSPVVWCEVLMLHLNTKHCAVGARLAMKGYLATVGSDKVGFTTSGTDAQGQPDYVGGVRGVVERNTMRYYLAIDAYLDAPGAQNRDKRAGLWFDSTERYARQLHELDRSEYLGMKQKEFTRLQGSSQ